MSNVLELRGVQMHVGAYHILHGVDLDVPAGQGTMLLGRNGAGKTSTLRTIMGLWRASAGGIAFQGTPIEHEATPDIARRGIAYVPENMGIFADLTVQENLLLAARQARHVAQLDAARVDWLFTLFPALKTFWNNPAGMLSGGQKQMLAVARAIAVVLDWFSRRVLSWKLSITMEASFCVEVLEDALVRYGRPAIFNTDQGSQFTGLAFTSVLQKHDIAISMDGKGAWRDNVFVERLWRSVKYEEVYLHAYDRVSAARDGIGRYLDLYNRRRPHCALDGKTPDNAYFNHASMPPIRLAA